MTLTPIKSHAIICPECGSSHKIDLFDLLGPGVIREGDIAERLVKLMIPRGWGLVPFKGPDGEERQLWCPVCFHGLKANGGEA